MSRVVRIPPPSVRKGIAFRDVTWENEATQVTAVVGGMEMDDGDLRTKLQEALGRNSQATRQEQENRERAQQWIKVQGQPAFDRLQRILNEVSAEVETNKWDSDALTGEISFNSARNKFTYLVDLTVSPKGTTGTTHIRAPDQEERTHGPVKDITKWTQEQIVDDFVKGLDSWHPEKK